jgi:hypothetical protein
MNKPCTWISGLALAFCASAYADSYMFTTLNDRGFGAQPTAINDAGQVTGNSDLGGFVYSNGTFTYIQAGGFFYAGGINNSGVVSGTLSIGGHDMGLIVNGSTQTPLSVPGSVRTLAYQINDHGIVEGYYTTNGPGSPFIYTYDGSKFTTIIPPGATLAFPDGINNAGQIVGEYGTSANTLVQFFYDGTTFHEINVPNSLFTAVTGISNSGIVFGYADVAGSISDFFYQNGAYSSVNAPGVITGMNDSGVIVGYYGFSQASDAVGFIGAPVGTSVPEPGTIALLCIGLIVVAGHKRASRTFGFNVWIRRERPACVSGAFRDRSRPAMHISRCRLRARIAPFNDRVHR